MIKDLQEQVKALEAQGAEVAALREEVKVLKAQVEEKPKPKDVDSWGW